jgi:hypothetical protein
VIDGFSLEIGVNEKQNDKNDMNFNDLYEISGTKKRFF